MSSPYSTCHSCAKDLFRTRKEARSRAKKIHPSKQLNAYYCPFGQGWHYGSLPDGGREQAREVMKRRIADCGAEAADCGAEVEDEEFRFRVGSIA